MRSSVASLAPSRSVTARRSVPERVGFVIPRYGAEIVGGAETLTRGLAEHLAASGTAVEVLTTCARDHLTWRNVHAPGVTLEQGVVVRRFPVKPRDARVFAWLHQRILRGGHLGV